MKKKLSLLMCAVMLVGMVLTLIPASAAVKTEGGPLAITEMCYAPANEKYEYIEVTNVSDDPVNLKDYYVYRFGFSNTGGQYHASGVTQMFGLKTISNGKDIYENNAALVKISMEKVDQVVNKGDTVIIWFASIGSKDETVDSFKSYWRSVGATGVKDATVVKFDVHDGTNNRYPANDKVSDNGTAGTHADAGTSFLPDQKSGFCISLINKSYAATDEVAPIVKDPNAEKPSYHKGTAEKTRERHANADCSAYVLVVTDSNTGSLCYANYVNKTSFKTAADAFEWSDNMDESIISTIDVSQIPAGLVVPLRKDGKEPISDLYVYAAGYIGDSNRAVKAFVFPDAGNIVPSNPGTLYIGQFGNTDGDILAENAANGHGSLNMTLKPGGEAVENLAVINKEEDKKDDTADTTAPAGDTPAGDDAATEGGCGSVVGATAIAVIAPVMAIGCGLTIKGKKRKED